MLFTFMASYAPRYHARIRWSYLYQKQDQGNANIYHTVSRSLENVLKRHYIIVPIDVKVAFQNTFITFKRKVLEEKWLELFQFCGVLEFWFLIFDHFLRPLQNGGNMRSAPNIICLYGAGLMKRSLNPNKIVSSRTI